MNLETAQEIIEQEALPILMTDPNLKFDVMCGPTLSKLFANNKSQIITRHAFYYDGEDASYCSYTFKIDHPKRGINYYNITYIYHPREKEYQTEAKIVDKFINLKTAQYIIEQEALLMLIADPKIKFNCYSGHVLSELFENGKSEVVSEYTQLGVHSSHYVFKIDHPKHGIGYYKVMNIINGMTNMIELIGSDNFKYVDGYR